VRSFAISRVTARAACPRRCSLALCRRSWSRRIATREVFPKDVFDGFQAQVANNRSQSYRDVAAGPFYSYNRQGAKPSEGAIMNWWRQGMEGGAKAHSDAIVAFSQTDFTADLKKITVPTLVMHGDDDPIVPYAGSGPLSAKLLQNDTINADLLAFIDC
jgi:non-heme chloroperoxidase